MMQHEGHVRILKSLKLFGMAHAIEELGYSILVAIVSPTNCADTVNCIAPFCSMFQSD